MPYKSVEEVPDTIPEALKEQWMEIWNTTFEKSGSEEDAFKAANAILKKQEMADFNSNWIEVFRAGDYGDKGIWTESDIDKVVANFAAGTWTPPAVVGHPKTDDPAMGWVKSLRRNGSGLFAQFKQVEPQFEASVREGRFPNRSAAFYTDPQGNGPVLRHIGFLGAKPPEVKGLAPIRFLSSDEFTTINYQEEGFMPDQDIEKKKVFGWLTEFFAERFGKKPESAATFNESQVGEMINTAVTAATKPLLDANKQLSDQFSELQKTLTDSKTEAQKNRAAQFVEGLKKAGKWLPAYDQMGIPALLEQAAIGGGTVKFGEGEKAVEVESFDQMCKFLESIPSQVPGGDITGKRKSTSGKVIPFNELKGVDLDIESAGVSEQAEKLASQKKISFGEALQRVAAGEIPA